MNGFYAQYFYLPSTTQGNPGGLNNDNEYPNGSGLDASWTSLLAGGNSSPTWSPVDTIPFNFNFNGSPVSTFKVSSSGVLTFTTNAGIAPIYANASIPDPGIPNNSIMVWGIEGTGSNDEIVTKTFGPPGGQQYWVFFSSYTAGSWTYWSIVFEEGTDKIYIVDQRHSNNATPQITAAPRSLLRQELCYHEFCCATKTAALRVLQCHKFSGVPLIAFCVPLGLSWLPTEPSQLPLGLA